MRNDNCSRKNKELYFMIRKNDFFVIVAKILKKLFYALASVTRIDNQTMMYKVWTDNSNSVKMREFMLT